MDAKAFAQKVKVKYPQYANVDDVELASRIANKYPAYREQLNPDTLRQPSPEIQKINKQIIAGEAFDETIPGKVMRGISKITPGDSYTDSLKKRKETLMDQESRGLSSTDRLKEDIVSGGKEVIKDTARFAPYVVGIGGAPKALGTIGKAAVQAGKQAGIISGSKFVEEMTKGEDIKQSAKQAAEAGVTGGAIALALPLSFESGRKVVDVLKPMLKVGKKGVAAASEAINSVPREYFERALDKELSGQSIFKGKWNPRVFDTLGKKAQRAINYVRKEAGEAVGKEAIALKGSKETISTKGIIDNIDELISQRSVGGEIALEPKDIKLIQSFRDKLAGDENMVVGKANIIKRQIQNKVKFKTETVNTPSSEGEAILKKVAGNINDLISDVSPKYREVNKRFSEIASLQDRLKTKLRDESVERNIRNLMNDKSALNTQELFRELDSVAPKNLKFMDKLEDSVARAPFEEWFPGRGGGSGGAQGIANFLRLGAIGKTGGVTAPLFSPKVAKKGIQSIKTSGSLAESARPLLERATPAYFGMEN